MKEVTIYAGKRLLGWTPRGSEVWVSMEVDKDELNLRINFTHELEVLLQDGAVMAGRRISVKKGSSHKTGVEELPRERQKNQVGEVTIQTLKHIQKLKNAVDMKFKEAYINGKPSSLLFSYVAWAIFEGTNNTNRGDTSWRHIKSEFDFPKDHEKYFTVESIPLFAGQLEKYV